MCLINRSGILLMAVLALGVPVNGQHDAFSRAAGGPFSNTAVLNSPFSADATTILREVLPDGVVREQTVTARYYRSSQGRVRAELDTRWGPYVVLALESPTPHFHLDPTTRTYRHIPSHVAAELFNGEGRVALPVGKRCFQIARPVVAGVSDAERLRVVNAEVSEDLGVVIASHRSDHIGSVDYVLADIRHGEPPTELFDVPSDYTFVRGSPGDPLLTLAPWQLKHSCEPSGR